MHIKKKRQRIEAERELILWFTEINWCEEDFLPWTKIIRRGKLILMKFNFQDNLFVCRLILTNSEFSRIVLSKLIYTILLIGYI